MSNLVKVGSPNRIDGYVDYDLNDPMENMFHEVHKACDIVWHACHKTHCHWICEYMERIQYDLIMKYKKEIKNKEKKKTFSQTTQRSL